MIIKDTLDYTLRMAATGTRAELLRHVFKEALTAGMAPIQVAEIGVSIVLNVLINVHPDTRARIRDEIKATLLASLEDAEEYARMQDAGLGDPQ